MHTPCLPRLLWLTLLVSLSFAPGTSASEPRVLFSGFGTLGYAVLDDDEAEYRTGRAQDGADNAGSFEVDSRLGLQLDAEWTPKWSGTVQGLVREGGDGDVQPELEWAFLRWLPSELITLRAGRLALPAFAVSDYREVGYANVMLRSPEEVYTQVTFRSIDGVDVSTYTDIGNTLLSLQVYAGQTDHALYDDIDVEARDTLGFNVVAEHGPLRLRFSHIWARAGIDSPALQTLRSGLIQASAFVPELGDIADEFDGRPRTSRFGGVGVSLDFERFFIDTEFTQRRVDSWAPDVDGWYALIGMRIGSFTPYAFTSAFDGVEDRRFGLELPDSPMLEPIDAALRTLLASKDQATLGLGLRWDFAPNLAFKAQIEEASGENGRLFHSLDRGEASDANGSNGDVILGSIAIDFVF